MKEGGRDGWERWDGMKTTCRLTPPNPRPMMIVAMAMMINTA